jgi:hypothetical protein
MTSRPRILVLVPVAIVAAALAGWSIADDGPLTAQTSASPGAFRSAPERR